MHRAPTAVLALSFSVLFGILAAGCSGPDVPKATGTSSSSASPTRTSAVEDKDKDAEAKESSTKEGDASGSEGSLTTDGK